MPSQIRSHIIYPSYFSLAHSACSATGCERVCVRVWVFYFNLASFVNDHRLITERNVIVAVSNSDHIHVHIIYIYYSKIIPQISCQQFVLFLFFYFFLFHRYNISWTVDSHTPVEEFKLFFRRLPQGHDLENSIEHSQQPLQHHNGQAHRYGNVIMHWSRNDWRDVVLPAVPLSHHYTQSMSYMIRGLDPDQQYEARVQARYVCIYM